MACISTSSSRTLIAWKWLRTALASVSRLCRPPSYLLSGGFVEPVAVLEDGPLRVIGVVPAAAPVAVAVLFPESPAAVLEPVSAAFESTVLCVLIFFASAALFETPPVPAARDPTCPSSFRFLPSTVGARCAIDPFSLFKSKNSF